MSSDPGTTRSRLAGGAYWAMMRRVVIAAGCIDALGIPLYAALGSWQLAALNVGSVVLYALVFALVAQRRNRLAVGLMWFEVLTHSALGSLLIGWDSGFHYFLLMFIPAIVIGTTRRRAVPMVATLLLFYLGLKFVCDSQGALTPLQPWALRTAQAVNVLLVFALFYTMASYYRAKVIQAEQRLLTAATTDPLTGLDNRSQLRSRALGELRKARRRGASTVLILADVDHFKRINDEQGHAAGDRVLVSLAALLRANLREVDILARWGGEEFLALLPDTSAIAAVQVAERLRQAVAATRIDVVGHLLEVTMSFGIAEIADPEDLDAATVRADRALYLSKREGRDRVSCASTLPQSTARSDAAVATMA
jgi:diguanylate cyclase (GGDEF)-like protein